MGRLESAAWVAYYRRNWLGFLRSALALSRQVAGLTWPVTILCSSLVLRAVRLWAPIPDNDPDGARRVMERFYRILKRGTASQFDPARAAALELDWWRVHRDNQYGDGETDDRDLAGALASLYAHLYDVPEPLVRVAAEERTRAMRISDEWVRSGCRPNSPLIDQERDALVRSYGALRAAVSQ